MTNNFTTNANAWSEALHSEYGKILAGLIERVTYLEEMASDYEHELNDALMDFEQAEDARLDLQKKLDDRKELEKINERRIEELKNRLKTRNRDIELLTESHERNSERIYKMVDFARLHREEIEKALTPFDFLVFCECFDMDAEKQDPGDADCDPWDTVPDEDPGDDLGPWEIPDEDFFEEENEDEEDLF